MGGASAPPFFRHFPFKIGDLEALPGKICLPLIFLCLPLIFLSLPLSKTKRRVGKIWRRKVFPKVKNVNVESLKKRSKLLFFSAHSFLFPLQVCSWMGSSRRLSFCFGNTNCFWEHELIVWARIEQGLNKDWTRIEQELFMNCSRFVQKLMRRLMRQLMGINGETFLAGSDLSPIFSKFLHNPNKCLTFAAQEPAKPLNDA